jgi:hypothetical protein
MMKIILILIIISSISSFGKGDMDPDHDELYRREHELPERIQVLYTKRDVMRGLKYFNYSNPFGWLMNYFWVTEYERQLVEEIDNMAELMRGLHEHDLDNDGKADYGWKCREFPEFCPP